MEFVPVFGAGRIGSHPCLQPGRIERRESQDACSTRCLLPLRTWRRRWVQKVASIETALADPSVQAVAICSSTDTHSDLITRSAAASRAHLLREAGRPVGAARGCPPVKP